MANIRKIELIDEDTAAALDAAGLNTVEKLLQTGATADGRGQLQQLCGLDPDQLQAWLLRADLFRLKGVSSGYADLLAAAGITSVPDLARRQGRPLHREMAVINRERKLVRQLPPVSHVERWVDDAAGLPPIAYHEGSARPEATPLDSAPPPTNPAG